MMFSFSFSALWIAVLATSSQTFILLLPVVAVNAQNPTGATATTPPESTFLKIDQFGYLPSSPKVAVISNPQIGFNGFDTFVVSDTTIEYEVREWTTGTIVFQGPIQSWNDGAIAPLSGDAGWWFDFSVFDEEGTYYVYDPYHDVRSYEFVISASVYDPILRVAGRMFYYQRCGIPKLEPYAEIPWTYPGAAFAAQDNAARYYLAPEDATTERNLTGGWFDAGDFNKYVTFANRPVHDLLWAYRENPEIFQKQDWNIPHEADFGDLPDLLKEVKWELDWLLLMNDPEDGSTILKVGSIDYNHNSLSPPDANSVDPRYHSGNCTSASIAVAGMFAHASTVFQEFSIEYATTLRKRAIGAWSHILPALENNDLLETDCDDGTIKAGDADWTVELQLERAITAAVYLLEATGDMQYNDYIVSNIEQDGGLPITGGYWDYYNIEINDALLLYTNLSETSTGVVEMITKSIQHAVSNNSDGFYGLTGIAQNDDLYPGSLPEYYWGSNRQVASMGILNLLLIKYGVVDTSGAKATLYEAKAMEMLHYLHGVNPLGLVYLTNMYNLGADKSANEMYHGWFADGSNYDNVLDPNNFGPPPGYVTGGANQAYTGTLAPPARQPPQKSYLDFNTGYPDNSWEITEPAIYYQGAYVRLLAHFVTSLSDSTCLAAGTSCLRGVQDGDCNCVMTTTVDDSDCPPVGTTCDDGISNTTNDVEDSACICEEDENDHIRCEMIKNGSFDEDVEGWNYWGCTATSIDGVAVLRDIRTVVENSWDVGFGQNGMTLVQDKAYKLSFDAFAAADRTVEIKVGLATSPFTTFFSQIFDLSTTTNSFSSVFVMTQPTNTIVGLDFFLGGGGSSNVYLDNIVFEAVDCDITDEVQCTVVEESSFEDDNLSKWSYWGCFPASEDGMVILSDIQTGEPWDASFGQRELTLHQGYYYTVSFAGSASANRPIDVKVGLPIVPYTNYIYETLQLLGNETTSYNVSFLMTEGTTSIAGVDLYLGANSADVILKEFSLTVDNCLPENESTETFTTDPSQQPSTETTTRLDVSPSPQPSSTTETILDVSRSPSLAPQSSIDPVNQVQQVVAASSSSSKLAKVFSVCLLFLSFAVSVIIVC